MKYIAIIQARVGSTRLPNKVLMDLRGKSVLEHVVERVKCSKLIDEVYVATSISKNNEFLIEKCVKSKIRFFIGSEDDVLDRFYQLAKLLRPDNIVRITADCPLIDSDIIDNTIKEFEKSGADYCNNKQTADGLGSEIFTFKSLEEAWNKAVLLSEREHVTPYIKKHFKSHYYLYPIDISKKRWTLDEPEDYKLISIIYNNLYDKNNNFKTQEILKFLSENPEYENINSHIGRDEGYKKSLINDKIKSNDE